jgi:hypothetical protein
LTLLALPLLLLRAVEVLLSEVLTAVAAKVQKLY